MQRQADELRLVCALLANVVSSGNPKEFSLTVSPQKMEEFGDNYEYWVHYVDPMHFMLVPTPKDAGWNITVARKGEGLGWQSSKD
jgi:hypothetical protein